MEVTNHEIAVRFQRIADAMEVQGENQFKIRAYRKAVDTIDELGEPLADIEARGGLSEISGFGEAIIGKTRDFLTRGSTKLYEEMTQAVPQGVLEMAAIPGIGPKTVKALWQSLGITSVTELETAAKEQRIRSITGFGAAKEQSILEAIERGRRLSERLPLFIALPYAERLANDLAHLPGVTKAEAAGSLRRRKDTVGDLDFVVATTDPAATEAAIPQLPQLTEILESGHSKIVALCNLNLRVDIRLGKPEDFGALLHHFSSGQAHNIQLRDFAESHGKKINEYGVFVTESGVEESITDGNADESAIYAALGLPYIPVELREGRDEIAMAARGALPQLIEESDFRGQLHEHTTWSDGSASIWEMAEAAIARGYEYLAITDHSPLVKVANGLDRDRLLAQQEEIAQVRDALAAKYGDSFTLLSGVEVDILADGSLDGDEDILSRLDIVVASIHMRYREEEAAMTKRILSAIENPHVDIIGHPTGRLLGRREPFPVDMDAIIDAAARTGTVMEINASPDRMDINDIYARRACERGVKITVNADAHSIKGLSLLRWGLYTARRAGLTPEDVINTYRLPRLLAILKDGARN
jgi:DNA polymerase (family 10)